MTNSIRFCYSVGELATLVIGRILVGIIVGTAIYGK